MPWGPSSSPKRSVSQSVSQLVSQCDRFFTSYMLSPLLLVIVTHSYMLATQQHLYGLTPQNNE